jgi:hypothetical protein
MPMYEYHCDKCDREITHLDDQPAREGQDRVPQMRQQSSTGTPPRLHVSDIEEILIRSRG